MRILFTLASIASLGSASRAQVHSVAELDAAGELESQTAWHPPAGLKNLQPGELEVCPALVPRDGEKFTFKVRQYKNKALEKMSYHWVLHKVNDEKVDLSVGAGRGASAYDQSGTMAWAVERMYGMRFLFGQLADSHYFLTTPKADFTIRRIALSTPQRWTVHEGRTIGKIQGKEKGYVNTRLYWIRGHMGKYNVFKTPEDSAKWYRSHHKKDVEDLRLAKITKKVEDGQMTHTLVCKAGVDCGLLLTMFQVFRWEHFVTVAANLAPITTYHGGYQPDDGRVKKHSRGQNPVFENRDVSLDSLLEADATEEDVEDTLEDGLDDDELAEYFPEADEAEFAAPQ